MESGYTYSSKVGSFFLFLIQHYALKAISFRSMSFFSIVTYYFIISGSVWSSPYWWTLRLFLFFPLFMESFFIYTSFALTSTRVSLRSENAWSLNTYIFSFNKYSQPASKMLYQLIFPLDVSETIHFSIALIIPDITKLFLVCFACPSLMEKYFSIVWLFISDYSDVWTAFHTH